MADMLPVIASATADRVQLIDSATGELVDLREASDELLAQALDSIADHAREVGAWRHLVGDEVLRRMDGAASWTLHTPGGFRLTAPSSAPTIEYPDAAGLWSALQTLAEAGRFDQAAVDRAVEQVTVFKPRAAGLKALGKLGPDVRAVIETFAVEVEKPRSVRIARG